MTEEVVVTEEKPSEKKYDSSRKIAVILSFVALIFLVIGFGYGYVELLKVNTSLASMVGSIQDKITANNTALNTLQSTVSDLQVTSQKSAVLEQQQQQLIAQWNAAQKGDMDRWQLSEAQYFVKLANDQVQISKDPAVALTLLQRADQLLQTVKSVDVTPIRTQVTKDISTIQALPKIDTTQLYSQLSQLNSQIESLPLPVDTQPVKAPTVSVDADLPWWKTGLNRSWDALKRIVIIRNVGDTALPPVLPEEKNYLYQALHAQLDNAAWAVLHQNKLVYQDSLNKVEQWVKKFFVNDAATTQGFLQTLTELRNANVQPETIDLTQTVDSFNQVSLSQQSTPAPVPQEPSQPVQGN